MFRLHYIAYVNYIKLIGESLAGSAGSQGYICIVAVGYNRVAG